MQVINGITINQFIINDLKEAIKNPRFNTYNLFEILDRYLLNIEVMQLLNISKTTYFNYKKNKKAKYTDAKLYNLFMQIELD